MAVKTRKKPTATPQSSSTPGREFLMAALSMSWQLAIVVLVPILGGFQLDKFFNTLPGLTMVGFIIAMAGMGIVGWGAMKE